MREQRDNLGKVRFRMLWIVLGFLCLALGCAGVVLPVLPTTPFFLVTLFCFTKSSKRLQNWFVGTKLYRKHLESYVKKEGMSIQTKAGVIITVSLLMAIGFCMMARKNLWIPCILLGTVWAAHILYFVCIVKTVTTDKKSKECQRNEEATPCPTGEVCDYQKK